MSNVKFLHLTAIVVNAFASHVICIAQIPLAPRVTAGIFEGTESTPSYETELEEDRIIGGMPTTAKEFPYMVDIRFQDRHVCAGSYILPSWILTAAHCLVAYQSRVLNCYMGMTYLSDVRKAQMRNSSGIFPHENYMITNDTNDIGLVRLKSPFQLTDSVGMVPLAAGPVNTAKLCKIAGWGITNEAHMRDFTKLSAQLRFTEVPIMSQRECANLYFLERYQSHFRGIKVFCAGYKRGGHDACQGDSGGALVCEGLQVGLVSWGIGCGNDMPGVYSNVTTFANWIKATIARAKQKVEIREDYDSATYHPITRSISNIKMAYFSTIICSVLPIYLYLKPN